MKLFVLLLALAMSGVVCSFGDGDWQGNWLPVPDGYVWPKEVGKPPEFRPVMKAFAELPEGLREKIREYWPEDADPEKVLLAELDLNADGRPELFVVIPAYSGSGGVHYEIFSRLNGKGYRGIGCVQGRFRFLARKNGWLQIEGMSRGGGGYYTRYLMTFSGKGYVTSRCEGHDFGSGRVTIMPVKRKPGGGERAATNVGTKSG